MPSIPTACISSSELNSTQNGIIISPQNSQPASDSYVMKSLTSVKCVLVFEPSVDTPAMQTMMIMASITAYSTAVGPSSDRRKELTAFAK
jgi:hypothetical protein